MKSRRMTVFGAATAAMGLLALPIAGVGSSTPQDNLSGARHVDGTAAGEPMHFTEVDIDGLMSATVVDGARSPVGKIDELVVSANGVLTGAIVSVDGFLGFGTRPVSVDFALLHVEERTDDSIVVHALISADDLQDLPTFNG